MQIERVAFLRTWQEKGPPAEYWLTALFEPGDFLIAILYIASMDCGEPFHQLKLGTIPTQPILLQTWEIGELRRIKVKLFPGRYSTL